MIETITNTSGSWLPAALTAIGSFGVAALSFITLRVNDAKKDERTYQREKVARDEARRDRIIEKRNELQRQTLIDLQDAVQQTVRATSELRSQDLEAERAGLEWHKQYYPDELSERARLTNIQTTKLRVRIHDEEIRNFVIELRRNCTDVLFATNRSESERHMQGAVTYFDKLNERIGQVLRQLDEVERANEPANI